MLTDNLILAYYPALQMGIETSTSRELSIAHLCGNPFNSLVPQSSRSTLNTMTRRLRCLSGYVAQEFRLHLDRGARWFAVRENNRIVSFCLAFQIFERIWEIGGFMTLREYRREGFARAVLSAAIGYLKALNLIPRYQFHYRNSASRRLAESLGLKPRLIVDHYAKEGGFSNTMKVVKR